MKRVRRKMALTFDDVLLVPRKSKVIPKEVETKTKVSKRISLGIPIMSAAMDTVTESKLAIALAQHGGIGVIHKNMAIEEQANEVERVKKFESAIIRDPLTLSPEDNISKAKEIMDQTDISSFIIVERGKVVGILTNRDMWFKTNMNQKVRNVMTKDPITIAKPDTKLAVKLMDEHKIEKLPIVDNKGRLKGLMTITDLQKREQYPNSSADREGRLLVGAAIGPFDTKRTDALVNAGADILTVDTAHGHTENVLRTVRQLKRNYDIDVIAGNIATSEATKDLISAGADAVKIGMGPGSICTTRIVSGMGVPQVTAVQDCSDEADKYGIPVISDGGVKNSGDIAKAVAAGASVVMIGSLFAGTEESPGEIVYMGGRKYKRYRGMGSMKALKLGADRYAQSKSSKFVPEGVEGVVPYRGNVSEMVFQMVGGLRSSMGYCGCRSITEMRKRARFIRITKEGMEESHPHGVTITEESPNYWSR